jgi:FAD/FMN-containing dehydrogenase
VAKLDEQIKTFAGIVGDAHIKTDDQSLSQYSVDGSYPKAIVAPADIDQMSEVVSFADREGLSIVPWGSGSKMGLGNPPKSLDIVVLTTRLNHMVDVDSANLTVTMQAGVGFKESQAMLSMHENRCYLPLEDPVTESDRVVCSERAHIGAFVPFDPMFSESATIGGILAANSTGPRRLLYGMPRDAVCGAQRRYHRRGRQNR